MENLWPGSELSLCLCDLLLAWRFWSTHNCRRRSSHFSLSWAFWTRYTVHKTLWISANRYITGSYNWKNSRAKVLPPLRLRRLREYHTRRNHGSIAAYCFRPTPIQRTIPIGDWRSHTHQIFSRRQSKFDPTLRFRLIMSTDPVVLGSLLAEGSCIMASHMRGLSLQAGSQGHLHGSPGS